MFCINCGQKTTQVINSRQNTKIPHVWRRRKCKQCNFVFTTYESIALDQLRVALSGDQEIDFSHVVLLMSIARCFKRSDASVETAEALCRTIESQLLKEGQKTSPEAICEVSYGVLKHFDHIVALQYAAHHTRILGKHLR